MDIQAMINMNMFSINDPKALINALNNNQAKLGITINQNKTLADFTSAFNVVGVGNAQVQFIPNNFQYPDSEHFIITALRVYQGADANLDETDWTPGITDGEIQNGYFTLTNNGTIALKQQPFTRFSTGTNNADGGFIVLSKPIIWVGQTDLQVVGVFPNTLTTANRNIRFELIGMKLI